MRQKHAPKRITIISILILLVVAALFVQQIKRKANQESIRYKFNEIEQYTWGSFLTNDLNTARQDLLLYISWLEKNHNAIAKYKKIHVVKRWAYSLLGLIELYAGNQNSSIQNFKIAIDNLKIIYEKQDQANEQKEIYDLVEVGSSVRFYNGLVSTNSAYLVSGQVDKELWEGTGWRVGRKIEIDDLKYVDNELKKMYTIEKEGNGAKP